MDSFKLIHKISSDRLQKNGVTVFFSMILTLVEIFFNLLRQSINAKLHIYSLKNRIKSI